MNTRGLDTIFASCGDATGTWITSMRNSAVFGSLSGASPEHPASSSACRHLLRILDVRDVEDPHTAKTVLLRNRQAALFLMSCSRRRFRRKSLLAAIQPSIRHLHRHEQ